MVVHRKAKAYSKRKPVVNTRKSKQQKYNYVKAVPIQKIVKFNISKNVINDNEEAKKAKGRSFMIWGIIALTVMISIWGLVRILTGTFNIDFTVPQVHTQ